jgi:hypothetical protein
VTQRVTQLRAAGAAQYPPNVREDMRVVDYIREVADDRKARAAGVVEGQVDTPEVGGGGRAELAHHPLHLPPCSTPGLAITCYSPVSMYRMTQLLPISQSPILPFSRPSTPPGAA